MRPNIPRKLLLAAPLGLALTLLPACSKEDEGKPKAAKEQSKLLSVEVMTVQQSSLQRTVEAVGTVRYRRETPLGFTTAGRVSSVRYNEGDFVKRGATLAGLDRDNVAADLSVTQAEADRASAEFARIAELYKQGWVTKRQYEATEAALKAANARVKQARYASGTSHIHAPSSGVILSRNAEPGQVVAAGTPILVLGENSQGFEFRVPVVDRDASNLRVGMPAEISISSLDGGIINATISEIDGRANQATGAFTAIFRISARSGMRSGQIGSAKILLPATTKDGALRIPASALFDVRTGEGLVYIVNPDGNKVETRNVFIERVMDDAVVISGGIKPGDVIVTSGGERLRTGAKVRPVQAKGK